MRKRPKVIVLDGPCAFMQPISHCLKCTPYGSGENGSALGQALLLPRFVVLRERHEASS